MAKGNKKKTAPAPGAGVPKALPAASPAAASAVVAAPTGDKASVVKLLAKLEGLRGHPVISYWLPDTAQMSDGVVVSFFDQLQAIGKQDDLDLLLFTRGGATETPWRIISLLRDYCLRLHVLVPYRAHSSGTLLALGANDIVMTPLAELGPIDPSRSHALLPRVAGATEAEPVSVQDMRHAMQFIKDAAPDGIPYSPEAMAQIFTALFEKIHPLAIGAIEQSYALSKLIARNALATHMDPAAQEKEITGIVDRLCDSFKSHAYQISRREAKSIGLPVVDATDEEEVCLYEILAFYMKRVAFPTPLPAVGQTFNVSIAWLDSVKLTFRAEAAYRRVDSVKNELVQDQGWKTY